MSYTLKGKLILISEQRQISERFAVRDFVVETSEKYPQKIKFQCANNALDIVNQGMLNQEITVHFNINGRESRGSFFVNLNAWKIEGQQQSQQPPLSGSQQHTQPQWQQPQWTTEQPPGTPPGEDTIPF